MSAEKNIDKNIINDVAGRIERLIVDARAHIARSVNIAEVITKYEIGRIIVEVVQEGEGWSIEPLKICRRFYQIYSAKHIGYTPSAKFNNPR